MYRTSLLVLLALPLVASAQPQATHQVKLNGHTFTLPQGFTIEVAADAKIAPRPIAAAFDEKGRLYVTDSSGSNAKVVEQVKEKPHRILRLESTKGDGKFDKQTVFVKNVMFPEGCMWLDGSLYVAAPPHIWKFTDTDDDGAADREEIWFDGKTLTGCANDLHGPYRGPDGWIYWCKGAFAKQEHTVNGKKFTTRASHIFRARPDGSGIEPVMTGGMDNPVDAVFTPGGDVIFSTTFFQHPRDGKRDGLIHAVYGGVYGKDHDVVYEHPWTSPALMPVLTHMGPAAPCGLHRYESDQFGPAYSNNIFCCQFNLRKVSRHVLVPKGSTYESKDSDFVVSDNIDFHPTDVIEDADGSLLIVDTGGWYKLCCPTSQLVKPDVTGAIYRVKKVGAHKIDDPRGEKIEWKKAKPEELAKLLGDPRPVVRWRAVAGLAVNAPENQARIWLTIREGPEVARVHAVWAAARIPSPGIAVALFDEATRPGQSDEVRAAAARVIGLHRERLVRDNLARWLKKEPSAPVRRAIVEALGRIGEREAVPAILSALESEENDRAIDHALTYALIEIGDAKATLAGLKSPSPRVRRAALAALSNIPESGLDAKTVLAELDAKDAALRDTAWWIAGRHPQWGDALAGYFKDRLAQLDKMTPTERDELAGRAVPFLKTPAIQKAVGEALNAAAIDPGAQRPLLRALARSGVKQLPNEWTGGLTLALVSADEATMKDAFALLRAVPPSAEVFATVIGNAKKIGERGYGKPWTDEGQMLALAAAPGAPELTTADFALAVKLVAGAESGNVRAAAADALARSKLTADQLAEVAGALKAATPLELPKLVGVFDKSKDEKVGLTLVAALRDPKVRPAVRTEMVKPILDKYPKAVKDEAEKLYAELAEARKGETARLEKLLKEMPTGDIRRGQLVFNSTKTNCIACHKVGYVGGTAGPDLTRIGGIRTERDLLESVIYPSASFVRSYEPYRVVTKDDRTLNGVLKKDAPDEIVIITAADKEERVARADIESIAPSTVSLMPAGMEQQLTQQELADLITFLRACK